jgi:hypothetical protein
MGLLAVTKLKRPSKVRAEMAAAGVPEDPSWDALIQRLPRRSHQNSSD